ncbi:MAG: hypothetical protein RBU23_13235 [Candidatus Auribacterota bacterium]|jgi:hypothetical protein|nr:hypothetical protein [Candidatus Auribacterota bacterium]
MKYALLTFGEYYKLNKVISLVVGWDIGIAGKITERYAPMTPELTEQNGQLKCVIPISAEIQENHADLLTGVELVNSYISVETEEVVPIDGVIEPEVIDWTLNHYEAQGVDNSNLVTYIAGQDASNYPPIPNVGEWCEAKVYSYNGDKVKCLQPHTRTHYTPEETPALWLIIPTVSGYPEWVQPTGSHDAYNTGDRVLFEGKNYESLIDSNVWSPTGYPQGWKEI